VPVFLDLARSRGYAVLGVDAVPEVAAVARRDFGIEVLSADFDRCELPNGTLLDVVTMWDFLEHVPDPLATLARARRWLRPGGVLFVSAPNYRSLLHKVAGVVARVPHPAVEDAMDKLYHFSHVSVWSPRAIETALTSTGFTPLAHGFSSPDLNRYRLGPTVRASLTAIDWVSRLTGLRSRLWVLASASG
jgi:SAM-dependent methyltransferase